MKRDFNFRKVWNTYSIILLFVAIVTLSGCASMFSGLQEKVATERRITFLNNSRTFNVLTGSSEPVIASEESGVLRIMGVKINSLDGIPLNWQVTTHQNPLNYGVISRIPPGKHTFYISYLETSGVRMSRNFDGSYSATITSVPVSEPISINFVKGHWYNLAAGRDSSGRVCISISDITYTPIYMYGSEVEVAPKRNRSRTLLEGRWNGAENNCSFTFSGNHWVGTIMQPPAVPFIGTWEGNNNGSFYFNGTQWLPIQMEEPRSTMRGTFTITDDIITLHILEARLNGIWHDVSSMRSARIFKYRFENDTLILDGSLPESSYIRN